MDTANFIALQDEPSFAQEVQPVTNFLARVEQ